MTFLLFSVILQPMLMILFSTLGMSKHVESELQDIIGWDRVTMLISMLEELGLWEQLGPVLKNFLEAYPAAPLGA